MDRPKSRLTPALLIVVGPFILLAAYGLGYWMAIDFTPAGERVYMFKARWKCAAYKPAALLESWITGRPTRVYYEWAPFSYLPYEEGY